MSSSKTICIKNENSGLRPGDRLECVEVTQDWALLRIMEQQPETLGIRVGEQIETREKMGP